MTNWETIPKEVVVAYVKVVSQHLLRGVTISGIQTKFEHITS